jgi:hypothetical protein
VHNCSIPFNRGGWILGVGGPWPRLGSTDLFSLLSLQVHIMIRPVYPGDSAKIEDNAACVPDAYLCHECIRIHVRSLRAKATFMFSRICLSWCLTSQSKGQGVRLTKDLAFQLSWATKIYVLPLARSCWRLKGRRERMTCINRQVESSQMKRDMYFILQAQELNRMWSKAIVW